MLNMYHKSAWGESCFCFLRLAPHLPEHVCWKHQDKVEDFCWFNAETNVSVRSEASFFVWSALYHRVLMFLKDEESPGRQWIFPSASHTWWLDCPWTLSGKWSPVSRNQQRKWGLAMSHSTGGRQAVWKETLREHGSWRPGKIEACKRSLHIQQIDCAHSKDLSHCNCKHLCVSLTAVTSYSTSYFLPASLGLHNF